MPARRKRCGEPYEFYSETGGIAVRRRFFFDWIVAVEW
jgi:hypothetical protein